jgi:hypothetical protein
MKRMMLAVVTGLALACGGLMTDTAQADHPHRHHGHGGYGGHGGHGGHGGYRPGGVAVGYRYGGLGYGYGYGSNVNIALRSPNIAYSAGYGYAPSYHCYPPPPCGYSHGYSPYVQRPRVSFSFGY